jgi:ribokinase
MTPPEIIVVGSTNTDLVVRVPTLPRPAETILGGEFFQAAGGKGANQAVAAARASHSPVCFVTSIGDDGFGKASLATLNRENLVTDQMLISHAKPSGVALIVVDDLGQNQIAVAPGANHLLTPDHIDALPKSLWKTAKVLLVSLEIPIETALRALSIGKKNGLLTILNPAPAQTVVPPRELLEHVDLVTPNEREASSLADFSVDSVQDAIQAAHVIAAQKRRVVITLGALGAVVYDETGHSAHLPPFQVEPVDTVAAGDALNGALAVALAEGQPLVEAVRWSMRAAAISVTRSGAQPSLPTRSEIDAFGTL